MFWNAMKTHFFMKIQIFSGSNLGRKTRHQNKDHKKLFFKTVKKCLPTQSLQKICTKKANSKQLSFLYQTFPHEIPTNKSPTKASYPQKKSFQKIQKKYLQTTLSQKLSTKNIKDISDNKNLTRTVFWEKQGSPLQKRAVTNKQLHSRKPRIVFAKNNPKSIQTTSHRRYLPQKCSPQNLFWTKQKGTKNKRLHQTMVSKFWLCIGKCVF